MMTEQEPLQTTVSTLNPCACKLCSTTHVVHHWYCDNCAAGPFRFSPHTKGDDAPAKAPYGARQYNGANNQVFGKRYWCSKVCQRREEHVYLMDQLDKARARHNVDAIRVLTGRLHELEAHPEIQIDSLPEPFQRASRPTPEPPAPPPAPEVTPALQRDPTQLELDLLGDAPSLDEIIDRPQLPEADPGLEDYT